MRWREKGRYMVRNCATHQLFDTRPIKRSFSDSAMRTMHTSERGILFQCMGFPVYIVRMVYFANLSLEFIKYQSPILGL